MLEKRKEEDDEEEKGEEKRKKNDNRKQEEAKTLSIMDSQCRVQLNGLSQKSREERPNEAVPPIIRGKRRSKAKEKKKKGCSKTDLVLGETRCESKRQKQE